MILIFGNRSRSVKSSRDMTYVILVYSDGERQEWKKFLKKIAGNCYH